MPGDKAMEDVQRFFRHLVRVLAEGERDRSREPIEIAEIYQSILPYRQFRGALEFDTNQDYEMALLRLLAGEGGFASVDPVEAQEALSEEASSINPNPAAYREYAAAKVYLNVNAVHTVSDERDPYAPPTTSTAPTRRDVGTPQSASYEPLSYDAPTHPAIEKPSVPRTHETPSPSTAKSRSSALPFIPESSDSVTPPPGLERGSMFTNVDRKPMTCPFCSRGLPSGRAVKFCPYCGQDISTRRCRSCGNDVGADWVFCVDCGADVTR